MALRKLLILRRPRSGRLEGRTTLNPGSRRFSDSSVSFAPVASRDRGRGSLSFQPTREVLLQIYCRCSHRQQSVQFMIAGSRTPAAPPCFCSPVRGKALTRNAADLAGAMAAVAAATAQGAVT